MDTVVQINQNNFAHIMSMVYNYIMHGKTFTFQSKTSTISLGDDYINNPTVFSAKNKTELFSYLDTL